MTPSELEKALILVQQHLGIIQYLLDHLSKSKPIWLQNNSCPECHQRTLYLWCAPVIAWSKKIIEEKPWEILKPQGFQHVLDGQCYNRVCGFNLWPLLTRMDPSLLERAPADAIHYHDADLTCPHCSHPTCWGSSRDGKLIAGQCRNCEKSFFYGDSGRSRLSLFIELHRRQIWLESKQAMLFKRQLADKVQQLRETLPDIDDLEADD